MWNKLLTVSVFNMFIDSISIEDIALYHELDIDDINSIIDSVLIYF